MALADVEAGTNGNRHVSRVETDSEKYNWLNRIDFVAPGQFNGTEVMTVNHYFPTVRTFHLFFCSRPRSCLEKVG